MTTVIYTFGTAPFPYSIILVKESLCFKKFCIKNTAKGSTTFCVVAEGNKLNVKYITLAEPSENTSHSLFSITVTIWLRTIFFFTVNDWMFWCRRKL